MIKTKLFEWLTHYHSDAKVGICFSIPKEKGKLNSPLNEYITRLASGNFEVRIPIPENLKEKNLMVYYVGEDNKIEEYINNR